MPPLPAELQSASLPLTEQDKLFVSIFRSTGDPLVAAVKAKMFDPNFPIDILARNTLERPEIQEALALADAAERAAAQKSGGVVAKIPIGITQDSVIADFQQIFEVAMGHELTTEGENGEIKVVKKAIRSATANLGAAIAAKKNQAAVAGLLKSHVDINLRVRTVDEMSDEDLERIARQGKIVDATYTDVTEEEDGNGD